MRGYASVAVLALADSAEDAAAEDHGEELNKKYSERYACDDHEVADQDTFAAALHETA